MHDHHRCKRTSERWTFLQIPAIDIVPLEPCRMTHSAAKHTVADPVQPASCSTRRTHRSRGWHLRPWACRCAPSTARQYPMQQNANEAALSIDRDERFELLPAAGQRRSLSIGVSYGSPFSRANRRLATGRKTAAVTCALGGGTTADRSLLYIACSMAFQWHHRAYK